MKKYFVFGLSLIACFMHLGSYQPVQAAEKAKTEVQAVTKFLESEPHANISINYETLDKTIKNKENVPMLEVQGNIPSILIANNKIATCRINAFYQKKQKLFEESEKEYTKMAEQDYKMRTKEQKEYWHGYGLGDLYTTGRVDDKVISFIQTSYSYTGGAHPNSTRSAQTFNAATGKRLTLKDITTDRNKAVELINAFILKETKKDEYKDILFKDYEKDIKDILTEDTWYLSDQGLVIMSNEYIISPHSTGILEFTIPYDQMTYLNAQYLPKADA